MIRLFTLFVLVSVWTSLVLQELPVKKVVIYKNGISYVERETTLNGSGQVSLKFKARQMRDVLKTLFAVPLQEGFIQNIDYQTEDPISKKLEDIYISLPNINTLSELLKSFQSIKIKIARGEDSESVTVLGLEIKKTQTKEGSIIEEPLLIYLDSSGRVASMDISALSFTIEDEKMKKDFEKLLQVLNSSKYADQKNISIYYKNFENSPLRVGYVIESPIWKTTYRLFLDSKPSALLQSFAIVENNTLDDWKDVNIVLVGSGPFSYLVDLYTTIIPSRPTISIEELFGIMKGKPPMIYYDERFQYPSRFRKKDMKKNVRAESEEVEQRVASLDRAMPQQLGEIVTKGLQALSRGKELGEYFSYEITQPVTILSGNAGLVNILTENIEGEKIVYYDEAQSPDVFNAFYLKNNTKKVLDNGFVTFFEGESTVGEGYLKTQLKSNDKEIITYGIEKSINVETKMGSTRSGYTSVKLVNGILTAQYYYYDEKKYKIFNKSQKPYTMIIDYHKRNDMELVQPTDATIREDLPNIYRFRIDLQPNFTTEFKVVERKLMYEYIGFDMSNIERIAYFLASEKLTPTAKKVVEDSLKILKEITNIEVEINSLLKRNSYLNEQLRIIRENIYALNTGNPQEANIRAKHVTNLDKYVTEYEQNENKRYGLANKKNQLLGDLRKLIESYSE